MATADFAPRLALSPRSAKGKFYNRAEPPGNRFSGLLLRATSLMDRTGLRHANRKKIRESSARIEPLEDSLTIAGKVSRD